MGGLAPSRNIQMDMLWEDAEVTWSVAIKQREKL